jgi:hypothetical protein
MAFIHVAFSSVTLHKAIICQFLLSALILQSCTNDKKIYKSNCDADITFKHIGFSQLIDSIKDYDQQYVEVAGTYKEAKEQSALFNDSLFVDHSNKRALWVNFSQDCPLYLKGTRIGLFEASDGQFTPINNKKIIIHGKINLSNTGHLGQYKGCIERVSFVEL